MLKQRGNKMKIGDRVIATEPIDGNKKILKVKGTIIKKNENRTQNCLVRFDKQITNLGINNDDEGRSWWLPEKSLKSVNNKMVKLKEDLLKWKKEIW